MAPEAANTAWNEGYASEPGANCPYRYDLPLICWWEAGRSAAASDRNSGRAPRWWEQPATEMA